MRFLGLVSGKTTCLLGMRSCEGQIISFQVLVLYSPLLKFEEVSSSSQSGRKLYIPYVPHVWSHIWKIITLKKRRMVRIQRYMCTHRCTHTLKRCHHPHLAWKTFYFLVWHEIFDCPRSHSTTYNHHCKWHWWEDTWTPIQVPWKSLAHIWESVAILKFLSLSCYPAHKSYNHGMLWKETIYVLWCPLFYIKSGLKLQTKSFAYAS